MAFPFALGSIAGDLYAQGLGVATGTTRLYDPDYALRQDPEAFEKLRRDATIAFSLRHRKLLAAGTDWYLEEAADTPEDRRAKAILEVLLRRVKRFASARFNLAEAVVRGSSWASYEVARERLDVPGEPTAWWWSITSLKDADKRRFRPQKLNLPPGEKKIKETLPSGRGVQVRETVVSERALAYVWQVYRPENRRWEDVDPNDWLHHVYDDHEETLGFGSGLASELFTYWWFKAEILTNGLQFVERWAQGLVSVMVDDNEGAAAANARLATWIEAIRKSRTQHILGGFKKDSIDVHEGSGVGFEAVAKLLDWLDDRIKILILGALAPTGSGGGSFNEGKRPEVELDSTQTLVGHDRSLLEETITRDVVGKLWRLNYPTLVALGLGRVAPPSFRIGVVKSFDTDKRIEAIAKARTAGLRIREQEAYSQTGFSAPTEGERCVGDPLPAARGLPGAPAVPAAPPTAAPGGKAFAAAPARKDMPQIKPDQVSAFLDYLRERGVAVSAEDLPVDHLQSQQADLNRAKVDRIKEVGLAQILAGPRLWVAHDHVLDGHHRAAALRELDPRASVPCWLIDATPERALELAHAFPGAVYHGIRDGVQA